MVENIKKELGTAKLDAVLLSHSHYDHVAGLSALRKEWPDLAAYGSHRAKEILMKPNALATIRNLSQEAADAAGADWDSEYPR
jgi:glyoxylase-like metal-dependent hydrolase (beta-lactamase superfamily II)